MNIPSSYNNFTFKRCSTFSHTHFGILYILNKSSVATIGQQHRQWKCHYSKFFKSMMMSSSSFPMHLKRLFRGFLNQTWIIEIFSSFFFCHNTHQPSATASWIWLQSFSRLHVKFFFFAPLLVFRVCDATLKGRKGGPDWIVFVCQLSRKWN